MISKVVNRMVAPVANFLRKEWTTLDPHRAYELWSETYDQSQDNALLFLEELMMKARLEKMSLSYKRVLDAGCGTGRYFRIMKELDPHQFIGIDFSSQMLAKAKNKISKWNSASLCEANFSQLPFKSRTFDFVMSTLALDHLDDAATGIRELSRVLTTKGRMLISLFHPDAKRLGWNRTFQTDSGHRQTYTVKFYSRSKSHYSEMFRECHLELKETVEPVIDETLEPFYQRAGRLDLYKRFRGRPLLVIFDLQKL